MSSRIPPTEITGVRGALVKRFAKKKLGQVPQPLGVYWHNPAVLRSYFAVSGKTEKWDACDKSLKSFAHMAVASLVGCTWCLDFGYFQSRNEDLDMEKARQVPRWRESDLFTAVERDVLAYAEAMTQTPPTVSDEAFARLLERLGPPAMVELTAVISLANFYARANVAFGIGSDGFAAACGLPPMAKPDARRGVGRAA
jgi:alkylhydroperoxidase family enzyme